MVRSRFLSISAYIRETFPKLKSSEVRRILDFIAVQHRGIHETNLKKAAEICAFLDKLAPDQRVGIDKLVGLVKAAQKMTEHEEDWRRRRARAGVGSCP
eukprot:399113-Prymnesium_polylepis.2